MVASLMEANSPDPLTWPPRFEAHTDQSEQALRGYTGAVTWMGMRFRGVNVMEAS